MTNPKHTNDFINTVGIYSISDLQRHYEKNKRGHWFEPDTMKFFNCRLSSDLFYSPGNNTIYFISSEKNSGHARAYSVRSYNVLTFEIDTIGEFQGYATLNGAKSAAKRMSERKDAL